MTVDLLNLTPREREVWDAAFTSGYLSGHEAGWAAADREAGAVFAAARRAVRAVAGLPRPYVDSLPDGREARAHTRRARRWVA